MNREYISYNGKKLRKGYTTGSCAAAAASAAAMLLWHDQYLEEITLTLPNNQPLTLPLAYAEKNGDIATAGVIKDGGDDADATHGTLICAKVEKSISQKILIDGGEGVGRVTENGLPIAVGEAAINPIPRKMISESVRKIVGDDQGAVITIYVPEGAQIAKQTMNARLGIKGGISILGTTGIVTPMSEEGWKQAISIELEMKCKQGFRKIVLAPGNYGVDFAVNQLDIHDAAIVSMSNFVGYVLKEVQRLAFEEILIVGHLGKLIKVAGGIFSTHSKDADARMEILVANLALMGVPLTKLKEIAAANTTEAAGELIMASGYQQIYPILAEKVKQRCCQLLKHRKPQPVIEVVLFSSKQGLLASTKPVAAIKEAWQ